MIRVACNEQSSIHKAQLKLIGASGLPGFRSVFRLFDVFSEDFIFSRGLAGGRGHTVHTNFSRRIHPRYPEASTIFFYFNIPHFVEPIFGILRQSNPPISRMLAF